MPVPSPTTREPLSQAFTRWFGAVMVAHVVGNLSQPDLPAPVGVVNLLVGLVGMVMITFPGRWLLLGGAALTVVSFSSEVPFVGNHWLVAGLAGLGVLLGGGKYQRFAPALRLLFLVFYGFAAFSKLNSAFFDPSVSCAVFYSNQSLDGFGLGSIDSGSTLAAGTVWASALIELSVVPLLLISRTRRLGVLVAAGFHILISYDLNQHFYDFTTVILAMLVLFLPEQQQQENSHVSAVGRIGRSAAWAIGVSLVVLASLPLTLVSNRLLSTVPFLLWIPVSIWWFWRLLLTRGSPSVSLRPAVVPGVVVVLAVLNGLTPYTELKTAFSFNMYSNLVTAGGETNHLLVSRTLPLRDGYVDPVEVLETSDPGLDLYRQQGYSVARPQLALYLQEKEIRATLRSGGVVAGVGEFIVEPLPSWWRWLPLRALDQETPARCQDTFLPAL